MSASAAQLWQVRLQVPNCAVALMEMALEDEAQAISRFEDPEHGAWQVDALFARAPDRAALTARIAAAAAACAIRIPDISIERLADEDWVARNLGELKPVHIGRYYVHGAHDRGTAPGGAWSLEVEAGRAFGTGRHQTTEGCLLALHDLARGGAIGFGYNALDLGTGSGLLAMAVARAGGRRILASDIDPQAVAVACGNVRLNRLATSIDVRQASGLNDPVLRAGAPYDLIVANILARPLKRLAPAIAHAAGRGGVVVLSGLLSAQARELRAVYRTLGLVFERHYQIGDWPTLVLRKPK